MYVNISGYVTKPFDYTELIEMIVNALKEGKRKKSAITHWAQKLPIQIVQTLTEFLS